jgi:hypothetical protein
MWYIPEPRPDVYIAILKAMAPTRQTWKRDLLDYGKIFAGVIFLWAMYTAYALITP